MHQQPVFELALFTVKPEYVGEIAQLRTHIQTVLQSFTGFISFEGYSAMDEQSRQYADWVQWESLAAAQSAAQAFENQDPRMMPYMQAIEQVVFMGHFQRHTH